MTGKKIDHEIMNDEIDDEILEAVRIPQRFGIRLPR
jgi:hypothetical protein